jgi:hypothetical protein
MYVLLCTNFLLLNNLCDVAAHGTGLVVIINIILSSSCYYYLYKKDTNHNIYVIPSK